MAENAGGGSADKPAPAGASTITGDCPWCGAPIEGSIDLKEEPFATCEWCGMLYGTALDQTVEARDMVLPTLRRIAASLDEIAVNTDVQGGRRGR